MKVPSVTKKPIFIFSHSALSFLLEGSHIMWSHQSSDSSHVLSSDHIMLQMVNTYCKVLTSFSRRFTPTVKWSYHSSSSLQ